MFDNLKKRETLNYSPLYSNILHNVDESKNENRAPISKPENNEFTNGSNPFKLENESNISETKEVLPQHLRQKLSKLKSCFDKIKNIFKKAIFLFKKV